MAERFRGAYLGFSKALSENPEVDGPRAVMNPQLTEADSGQTIELRLHEGFDLRLSEARMGGYRWTLLETGEPVLQAGELGTQPAPSQPGELNLRAWHFTAQKPGSTRIRLAHRRSWEPESSGREFLLQVQVAA